MNSSRVNKYRDLRAGLKDEAGINRENIEDTIDIIDDIEDDDFLATINRSFKQEEKKAAKKKMTLMERLASMSPEEDAKKAKLVMDEVQEEAEQKENELEEALKKDTGVVSSGTAEDTLEDEELAKIEQTRSLEEMLRQIKEKDQREVEKVLKQKEDTADLKVIKNQTNDKTIDSKSKAKQSRSDIVDEKKSDRIATILNYVIIFLVVVFIGLCGMIGYQLFF